MVKVQHGWQTRSLEEVESLASQSPRSSTSGFQHGLGRSSPRTNLSAELHRKWSTSDSSEGTNGSRVHQAGRHFAGTNAAGQSAAEVMARRALAPPADIVPGPRRRPTPNSYTVDHGVNGIHVPSLHVNTRPPTKQRTPSQNAAMEADAVETLMFMASPNNSGHHPATFTPQESSLRSTQTSLPQSSPLRSQFSLVQNVSSPKKVAFASTTPIGKPYDKIADIERMLDELSDEDSNDDLENAFNIAQRRQQAAV